MRLQPHSYPCTGVRQSARACQDTMHRLWELSCYRPDCTHCRKGCNVSRVNETLATHSGNKGVGDWREYGVGGGGLKDDKNARCRFVRSPRDGSSGEPISLKQPRRTKLVDYHLNAGTGYPCGHAPPRPPRTLIPLSDRRAYVTLSLSLSFLSLSLSFSLSLLLDVSLTKD